MELIGVFGVMGSGKSHFSAMVAAARGFTYISSDKVFKENVLPDSQYRAAITSFFSSFDIPAFVDGSYNTKEITPLLFSDEQAKLGWPILTALNSLTRPYIVNALDMVISSTPRAVLEMATLPNVPEIYMRCRLVLCVQCGNERVADQLARIASRDPHRDMSISAQVLRYQNDSLRHVYIPYTKVDSMQNGSFRSNGDMLLDFDRARMQSWMNYSQSPTNTRKLEEL